MTRILVGAARQLEAGGAGCVLIATSTMHKVASAAQSAIKVPLLHIGDTTACAIRAASLHTVGLLGTRFTMEEPFYREHLAGLGVESVVPTPAARGAQEEPRPTGAVIGPAAVRHQSASARDGT